MENKNKVKKRNSTAAKSKLRRVLENRGVYIALCVLAAVMGIFAYAGRLEKNSANEVSFDDAAWQEAVNKSKAGSDIAEKYSENSEYGEEREGTAHVSETPKSAAAAESSALRGNVPRENVIDVDAAVSGKTVVSAVKEDLAGEADKTVKVSADAEVTAAGSAGLIEPCSGRIIAECSVEDLVYCTAMDDWRTHNGTDYAASEGESVFAAADGKVSKVYSDDMLGVTVVIDHGEGLSTLYASLGNLDFIKAGTQVKQGDLIGNIGKSCALEKNLEPHLHFEVLKNGVPQNPAEFLSEE